MAYATLTRMGLLAGAALALCGPALGADATAAQAGSLEQQVRDALGGLLGPSVKLSDRPVRITAAGDHYDVAILPGFKTAPAAGGVAQDVQITATARPGDKGTWLIDGVRIASPLRFTVDMPLPPKDGAARGSAGTVPVTYTVEQTNPDTRIVWDPTFASPSTWTSAAQGTTIRAEGGPMAQTTVIGATNSVSTLRPVGADRVDVLVDGSAQDYRLSTARAGGPLDVGVKRVRIGMAMNGVSRAGSVAILQAMTSVTVDLLQARPGAQPPKLAPEVVRSVLAALKDFASDFTLDETLEGFIVKTQGQTVAMDQLKIGLDAKSEAGLLRAGMTMGVQGIALPDMPLGDMAVLIPTRVALHPVVGGIGVAELMRVAQAGSENKDPAPADIKAMFSHGGITAGLESLALDVAGASLTGQAKFVATGPSAELISGTAQLSVENFDVLMQKVNAIPALTQQAMPVMVFIKGIGRSVGSKLVYDVVYKDGKVLINNVDMTAMAGASAPAPAPAPRSPVPAPGAAPGPGGAPKANRPPPSWAK